MYKIESDDFDYPHWVNSREEVRGLITGVLIGRGYGLETSTRWTEAAMTELREGGIATEAAPGSMRIEQVEGEVA
ncbi:hypothetical protein [Streptomyces sp. 5-10]|uniref:hypothetical protein n=1 Tax=Streptomyces sp. 5-10 TaxID=878925 RepID=UPI00168ACF14|nr:hypothetical protein [Streptomyces sp. 5-10]MBD3004593.1 hypothetical protein [Streptomyces sp. 5-10]